MAWLAGWGYRKKNTVNGSTAGAQAVYPMKVNAFFKPERGQRTIGTSNSSGNWPFPGWPAQRCLFHLKGLYWAFYTTGGQMGFVTSSDGINWSIFTNIRASNAGYQFCLAWDGTYFHYSYCNTTVNKALFYRMFTPNADGTVTYAAAEQTVLAADASYQYTDPHISVDSNGYPWIAYAKQTFATGDAVGYVAKSSTKNGTWTHEAALFPSPYQFSTKNYDRTLGGPSAWCLTVPLTGGKVLAIVQGDGPNTDVGDEKRPYANLWNGAAWVGEEQLVASDIFSAGSMSAVAVGDDVHLTYTVNNGGGLYDFMYIKRTYGVGWGASELLVTGTGFPGHFLMGVLSKDDDNNLYAVWFNEPVTGTLYYRKNTAGVWAAAQTWLIEGGALAHPEEPTISDRAYDGRILFGYPQGAASPWTCRVAQFITADDADQFQMNPHSQVDFDDVRFTKADGSTLLYYWRETYVASDYAVFWVKLENIPASPGTLDYYVYYGNAAAADASDGDNTFGFYDHFLGVALDGGKWATFAAPVVNVAGSVVTVTTPTTGYKGILGLVAFAPGARWRAYGTLANGAGTIRSIFGLTEQAWNISGVNSVDFQWLDAATRQTSTLDGLGPTTTDIAAKSDGNYHVYSLLWKAGQVLFFIDDMLVATHTTNIPAANLKDFITVSGAGAQVTMDWTFIAGYVSPEPALSTWYTEESGGGGGGGLANKLLATGII